MKIKYRIVSIDHKEHSMVVRYFTDILTEDSLATQFDIDNNIVREKGIPVRCRTDYNITIWERELTDNQLHSTIKEHAPIQWLELLERRKQEGDISALVSFDSLIGQEFFFEPTIKQITPPILPVNPTTDEEIIKILNIS